MNYTELKRMLEKRSKDDLLKILNNLVQSNPSLVSTIEFYLSNTEQDDRIDLEPIKKKILSAVYGDLDYYHIDGALEKLYKVQKIAESLSKASKFKSAAEIYFLLVEGCVDAYDEGADDSSGGMGFLGEECILDFNKCMKEVKDEGFKADFIECVLELYWREDYGFNVEVMLEGTVTQANIHMLEKEFEDYLKIPKNDHHFGYRRSTIRRLMIKLYNLIEMPEKSLQTALKGLATADDYRIAAETLMELERHKEALGHVLNGLKLNESHGLFEVYFIIIDSLTSTKKGEMIDINEMITWAIKFISSFSNWSYNVKKYRKICGLFSKLNSKELFKEKLFNTLEGEILVRVLLEEGEILNAVETLKKYDLKGRLPSLALSIAHKAKKKEFIDIARKMIILAIKSGLRYIDGKDERVIRETLDKHSIEEIAESIPDNINKKISLLLAEIISVEAPHIIKEVIKAPENYGGKELLTICNNLVKKRPQDAFHLCEGWILKFVVRSHVYYDDVIRMLRIIKRALSQEEEWEKYLLKFMSNYKSRKKLIKMIQEANLS
ncbi:MAG: hypothetical protein CEE42_13580 [Promethearchaeota archaeon Loki_b31]|nr:MAG: hypothetical protein CEE42_13580 [Candidatus Lokiarchaeota archaeon Loki_b31]